MSHPGETQLEHSSNGLPHVRYDSTDPNSPYIQLNGTKNIWSTLYTHVIPKFIGIISNIDRFYTRFKGRHDTFYLTSHFPIKCHFSLVAIYLHYHHNRRCYYNKTGYILKRRQIHSRHGKLYEKSFET